MSDFDTPEHAQLRRQCTEKGHDMVVHFGAEPVIDGGLHVCKRCGKFVRGPRPEGESNGSQR